MKVDRGKKKLKANRFGENGNLEAGKAPTMVPLPVVFERQVGSR
jgi:hypothetical protein